MRTLLADADTTQRVTDAALTDTRRHAGPVTEIVGIGPALAAPPGGG